MKDLFSWQTVSSIRASLLSRAASVALHTNILPPLLEDQRRSQTVPPFRLRTAKLKYPCKIQLTGLTTAANWYDRWHDWCHSSHTLLGMCVIRLCFTKTSMFTSLSLIHFQIPPLLSPPPRLVLYSLPKWMLGWWSQSRQVITSLMDGESSGKGSKCWYRWRERRRERMGEKNEGFILAQK